jgi:Holliday junction resolvasome RuvABC endonuclease subunit
VFLWALDISLKNTGLTIYNLETKDFVYIGSFNTEKIRATKEYKGLYINGVKLKKIVDWIKPLLKLYPPTQIAIERGFSRWNAETQTIFRAHGVINCLLWNIPQEYYPPKEVKAVIVHGDATKEDVANAINTKYNDIIFQNEDESDSFAIAITYLVENGLIEWEKPNWAEIKKMRKPKPTKKKTSKKKE